MTTRKLSDIKKIIIHCSASSFGNKNLINDWHTFRGWDGCGYHYVICNGIFQSGDKYDISRDGLIQMGRDLTTVGAHCRGHNFDSIGICLIGNHHFTSKQLLESLPNLLMVLKHFGLNKKDVYGHCEFSNKTCPNINLKTLKTLIYKPEIKFN